MVSSVHPARPDRGAVVLPFLTLLLVGVVAGVLVAGLALPVVGGIGLAARGTTQSWESLPVDLQAPPLPQRSRILAADGSLLATFYDENRISVPLRSIAPLMRAAIVGIEDSRFYQHGGIDPRGTLRALVNNLRGQSIQGGSTLTQQYVKNVLIESAKTDAERSAAAARTPGRKLREARYAIALEGKLGKSEILNRYLNIAYFGEGAYGVEAASRLYFGIPASKLTLPQAALLAGLVQNPSSYDPILAPKLATTRRDVVLDRMATLGMITQAQLASAKATPLRLHVSRPGNGCESSGAPFFCDYVLRLMRSDPVFGATREDRVKLLNAGGLTIRTTIDPKIQKAAWDAVVGAIPATDRSGVASAAVTVQPGTGKVLAMVQSKRWGSNAAKGQTEVNYAVDRSFGGSSGFQAGSTFKAFTLATAIKQGLPLDFGLDSPQRRTFTDFVDCVGGGRMPPYTVTNDTPSGFKTLRTGTWESVNTFYVGLEQQLGICPVVDTAASLGMLRADGKPLSRVQSFTLGTDEVSPLRVAVAYATFAARGTYCPPVVITSVTDSVGHHLRVPPSGCHRALDETVADSVNQVLVGVIDGPDPARTGARVSIGRPAAGKTGTAENHFNTWFTGYTPQLATSVWVGHPTANIPMTNITINHRYYPVVNGGSLAGPIWSDIMSSASKNLPAQDFPNVSPVTSMGDTVFVPYVRGMDVGSASAAITAAGLQPYVGPTVGSSRPAGTVAFTSPPGGTMLPPGSSVEIFVSAGFVPQPPPVPSPKPTRTPAPPTRTPAPPARTPRPPVGQPVTPATPAPVGQPGRGGRHRPGPKG